MIDPVFSHIISGCFFALLVSSGVEKLRYRQMFSHSLLGYRLLPVGLVPVASIVIPLIEITLALAVIWLEVKLAALLIALLMTLYAAAIFINIKRGNLALDCGCQLGEASQSISLALVYRNLILAASALLLFLPNVDRSLSGYDFTAMTFGFLMCTLFYITVNTLIANATTYREIV